MNDILSLPQFELYVKGRKNAKHSKMKEEKRVQTLLKDLSDEGSIPQEQDRNSPSTSPVYSRMALLQNCTPSCLLAVPCA